MKTKNQSVLIKLSIIFTVFLFVSCAQEKYNESVSIEELSSDKIINDEDNFRFKETGKQPNSLEIETPKDLKIIKTATTRYKVTDVQKATKEIKKLATRYGAYISDLKYKNTLYEKQNKFTIKVPNAYFDVLMDSIATKALFVEFENITTKDVTEEYVDIETRLKTKMEVKERYEGVLKSKAKTVEDILLTEEKLRVIQEEIEASQGRLKYLKEKVAYSTINIDVFEVVEYKEEPESYTKTFADKAGNGFSFGWKIIEGFLIAIIHMWPIILIVVSIIALLKFYRRKKR